MTTSLKTGPFQLGKPFQFAAVVALLSVLAGVASAQTIVELRESVEIKDVAVLQLGHIALITDRQQDIARQLAELPLFPNTQDTQTISRQQVGDRLALLGVNLFDLRWTGAEYVRVVRSSRTTPPAGVSRESKPAASVEIADTSSTTYVTPGKLKTIESFCRRSLESQLEMNALEFGELEITDAARQSLTRDAQVMQVGFQEEIHEGVNELALELDVAGESVVVPLRLTAAAAAQVVFVKQQLAQGHVIGSDDLELRPVTKGSRRDGSFTDPSEVVGKETVYGINGDTLLTQNMVREKLLIRRNKAVEVEAVSGNLRVITYGKATEDGALGDMVTVELSNRRRKVLAVVVGENRVEVKTSTTSSARF